MAAAAAAPPPRRNGGPSPPDPADLGFPAPFRDPPPPTPPLLPGTQAGTLPNSSEKDHTPDLRLFHGSEAAPDSEDVRTPNSSEFFLRELESPDDDTVFPHEAFTAMQIVQLRTQILIAGDLMNGKPPAERAMVLAFGEPVEDQIHAWEEIWRIAADKWESQISSIIDTPISSSATSSCTSESKDTTVCKTTISEPHCTELHHNSLQHDGGEEPSEGLNVGSARGPLESTTEHTEVLKQQNGEEAVIISEPKQHAGGEEARKGVDVGSARSHPLVNITEHYCNLALDDRGSETRSLSKKKPDPCVKCGKQGQLLKCCTCSLAAHGRCFGSSVRVDDSGLFDCPVCFFYKADEAYEKAKIARSEARKNLSAFFCSDQSVKQHNENQSVKQGNHQSEAANLSRKDEEPGHEKRNATSDACPEKTTTFAPNSGDAKAHEVGSSSSSHEVPHSSENSFSPTIANCNNEASPMTRRCQVRFEEKETVVSHSNGKALGRQDQFMYSPARRRCYPHPPGCHSDPRTPARSPLAPRRRSFVSTARRTRLLWTAEEEASLREAVARFAPKDKGQISWVQIREHGNDVFHPTRLPNDLRQKWNYMKKRDEDRGVASFAGLDARSRRASLPPTWRKEACKDDRV